MAHRPVTLADIVAGHVSLEIEGFDRIYLNGWVPALQTSGQVAGWLHWRGFPVASPAALGRNSQAFRAAVRRYAQDNEVPWVTFRKGDRKLDVIRPYLEGAEKAGQSKVVAIGEAREFRWVFDATRKDGPDGVPWFRFYPAARRWPRASRWRRWRTGSPPPPTRPGCRNCATWCRRARCGCSSRPG